MNIAVKKEVTDELLNKIAKDKYGMPYYRLCWIRQKTVQLLAKAEIEEELR